MSKPAPSQLRELHGGKVNAITDAYLLTGDAEEHARLDAQHTAISLMLGGLFPQQAQSMIEATLQRSEENPAPAALDIGTGSGVWAIAVARQFSDVDVLGLDLVPVNAGSQRPSNCRFEICNANEELNRYPPGSFNVVHIRLTLQGVKDYRRLFDKVHRMLRPGGVLLVLEIAFALFDANKELIQAEKPGDPVRGLSLGFTWYHQFASTLDKATKARNPSFVDIERVQEILSEMGNYSWESVSGYSFFMPTGPWPSDPIEREAGELWRDNIIRLVASVRPTFISFGLSPEEADHRAEEVRAELRRGEVQQYIKFYQSWAVKKVPG